MKKHVTHFLLSTAIGLSLLLFFMVLDYLNGITIDMERIKVSLVITASYAYPLYYVSAYSLKYIKKLGNKYNFSHYKSVLIGFPFVILLNIASIVLLQYIISHFLFININLSFGNTFWDRIKVPLWISITIGAIFYVFNYLREYNRSKLTAIQEEANFVTQKHEVLKTQIGPHFLFNSLNVVSGLVDENPDKAQDFIADLAQVYRYVLEQKDKEWVLLSEEIQFAHAYIDLIQTRFEKGLNVTIHEDLNSSELYIAPLTLQLLLENCIKHNAIGAKNPLNIEISYQDGQLVVHNNINPKKTFHQRVGTGLNHINARYHQISEQVEIIKTTQEFIVKIPLFNQKTINMKTEQNFTHQELKEAREEVKERLGFYGNLVSYIIVCGIFVTYNLIQGGYFWAIWPVMGWGIGVLFHGLGTFYFDNKGTSGYGWQERQARKILARRKKQGNS